MSHIVTAALVIAKDEQGKDAYLYQGAPIPSFVKDEQLERFVNEGMVEEVSDGEAADAKAADAKPAAKK